MVMISKTKCDVHSDQYKRVFWHAEKQGDPNPNLTFKINIWVIFAFAICMKSRVLARVKSCCVAARCYRGSVDGGKQVQKLSSWMDGGAVPSRANSSRSFKRAPSEAASAPSAARLGTAGARSKASLQVRWVSKQQGRLDLFRISDKLS